MSDQENTHQMPEAEPPTEPQPQRPKRLLRSRDDRMLAGVAGGLGEYFGVDALIFRIAFGVSVFFGGLGALAYVAMVLFVPSRESDGTAGEAPIQRSTWLAIAGFAFVFLVLASWGLFDGDPWPFDRGWWFGGPVLLILVAGALYYAFGRDRAERTGGGGILATIAIVLAATFGLVVLATIGFWAGATGSGEWVAAVIVAAGVLLVIAAFRGGARWLIVPAVVLAGSLGAVAAADVSFDGSIGQRHYKPASVATIPADGYTLGIGQLGVDLRELDWNENTVVELDATLGVGQLVVAVPEAVCVSGDMHVGAGEINAAGDRSDGFDVDVEPQAGTLVTPRLELDAQTDLGVVQVINDDDAEIDSDDHGVFHDDDEVDDDQMRAAMSAACEPETEGGRRG